MKGKHWKKEKVVAESKTMYECPECGSTALATEKVEKQPMCCEKPMRKIPQQAKVA
ncbi:MAG: hypothetical protein HY537_16810 [Deltaproteobacteria bacterium]|nr:hypothetical protein [Deltaproteobacteria bacterium]